MTEKRRERAFALPGERVYTSWVEHRGRDEPSGQSPVWITLEPPPLA